MDWYTCKSLLNTLGRAVEELTGCLAKQAKLSSRGPSKTRPVGREGSRGFARTPLLVSERFYIHRLTLHFKYPTVSEIGALVSLLLRITTVQTSVVAAM